MTARKAEQAPSVMLGALPGPTPEPTDLAVAIRVAEKMLAAYGDTSNLSEAGYAQAHGALSESLRILLRAVGAEVFTDLRENSSELRCPAAHPDDLTPCASLPAVTVLDKVNAGADGCEHHGARLLASLDGGRVYTLPDGPEGAAIRVFKAADGIRPFPWHEDAPRTRPDQLSHAENRRAGEGQ